MSAQGLLMPSTRRPMVGKAVVSTIGCRAFAVCILLHLLCAPCAAWQPFTAKSEELWERLLNDQKPDQGQEIVAPVPIASRAKPGFSFRNREDPCASDIAKLCGDVLPDVMPCLKQHATANELSDECVEAHDCLAKDSSEPCPAFDYAAPKFPSFVGSVRSFLEDLSRLRDGDNAADDDPEDTRSNEEDAARRLRARLLLTRAREIELRRGQPGRTKRTVAAAEPAAPSDVPAASAAQAAAPAPAKLQSDDGGEESPLAAWKSQNALTKPEPVEAAAAAAPASAAAAPASAPAASAAIQTAAATAPANSSDAASSPAPAAPRLTSDQLHPISLGGGERVRLLTRRVVQQQPPETVGSVAAASSSAGSDDSSASSTAADDVGAQALAASDSLSGSADSGVASSAVSRTLSLAVFVALGLVCVVAIST